MSELKQRAERLREWLANPKQCYDNTMLFDATKIAEAYLAEHLLDDDEPVTSQWLDTIGWRKCEKDCYQKSFFHIEINGGQWLLILQSCSQSFCLCELNTRGQLRLLCRGLNVEVPK